MFTQKFKGFDNIDIMADDKIQFITLKLDTDLHELLNKMKSELGEKPADDSGKRVRACYTGKLRDIKLLEDFINMNIKLSDIQNGLNKIK